MGANPLISNCVISYNHAGTYGGGVFCQASSPIITHCVISFNNTVGCGGGRGGGITCDNASPQIINCTISGNAADALGGGMYLMNNSHPALVNSIIQGNTRNGGIYFDSPTVDSITYCDFQGNVGGNFIGLSPTWLGRLVSLNAKGDSCDTHHNILLNPLFVSGSSGDYHLQAASPCIDAGNPASPPDPDGTVADMGAYYFDQTAPPLNVTLTPINPPINIPPGGGFFQFNAAVQRTVAPQTPFWVWARIKNPNGTYTAPTVGPVQINPPVGVQVSRNRTQNVPGTWASGTYTYLGYADSSPQVYPAIDSSSFTFVKLTDGPAGPFVWEASCTGEPFPYEVTTAPTPTTHALIGANPNPFNSNTVISYRLSAISHVSLKVYDTAGRLVVSLVEGRRDAGTHDVTFDGSNLASGMYICRLWAGDQVSIRKLILLK